MFKKLFGLAPVLETDGSYTPSRLALKLATSNTTNYKQLDHPKYQGSRTKILVLCTELKNMRMKNGKLFSTGNHPVETFLPMLHLQSAGFEFDIVTPTGKPVVLEMWAFPEKDDDVQAIFRDHQTDFSQPKSLKTSVETIMEKPGEYAAVFIPGGHGAMLGLPEDSNVSKLLHWAHENGLLTIALCHGPAALLATTLNNQDFLYDDYKMAVFPDSVDNMTPKIGYLPGKIPWGQSKKLEKSGATIINKKADDTVCLDRTLITGASPDAANELGVLATNTLLQAFQPKETT